MSLISAPITTAELAKKLEHDRQEVEFHSILKSHENEVKLNNLISEDSKKRLATDKEKAKSAFKSKMTSNKDGYISIKDVKFEPSLEAIRKAVGTEMGRIIDSMEDIATIGGNSRSTRRADKRNAVKRQPVSTQEPIKATKKVKKA